MRDALDCSTVLTSQVVLCATVILPLGLLLSICATLPIIWREQSSENARAAQIEENGVVLFHDAGLQGNTLSNHRMTQDSVPFNSQTVAY